MIYISARILPFLLPLVISIPCYVGGRKLFFKGIPQSQMHMAKGGRLFTGAVALVHLALTAALCVWWFFPELYS